MAIPSPLLVLLLAATTPGRSASPPAPVATAASLPGRELDARVAAIADRLATAGLARCSRSRPTTGFVLEHLSQFALADRAGMARSQALDRGPEVIVVVAGTPAAAAGVEPGDVVLAVDGVPIPSERDLAEPFDMATARARADAIDDLIVEAPGAAPTLTLLRHRRQLSVALPLRPACPSRVHLARSAQLNAFADGRHVLLTTGVVARLANDDELAFVIAHEMAHNILGHAALMHAGAPVRQVERDADRLGGELMLDAGYDPVVGAQALRRLGGLDLGIRLFASHDGAADRIEAMRRLVAAGPTR